MGIWKAGLVLVAVAGVALNLGCTPCTKFDTRPESVCLPPNSGALEGHSFDLEATVSSGAQVSCAVSVDGGSIELTLSGDDCPSASPFGAKPIVRKSTTKCTIPALDAGQYTVFGMVPTLDAVLNVGGDAGPGLPDCL